MIISVKRKHILIMSVCISISIALGAIIRYSAVKVFVAEDEGVPLLSIMYHGFSPNKSKCGKYIITPELFEQDMLYLIENGYSFVDTNDIAAFVSNQKNLPQKPAMITIDDGQYSIYEYIFPIMKKYGIKTVISPIAIESDKFSESMDLNPAYSNMCWDNIKEMSDSGLADIQNHSYNLHKLNDKVQGCAKIKGESTQAYHTRLYDDLKRADDAIFLSTGKRPLCMVYPFGKTSKEAREILDRLGYGMSVSCTEGISIITHDEDSVHMIKRYNRPYGISTKDFFGKIFAEK